MKKSTEFDIMACMHSACGRIFACPSTEKPCCSHCGVESWRHLPVNVATRKYAGNVRSGQTSG